MRKIFALICVFTLLFTLSACSSSEAELYEKYKDVILALENNNFDGAVNKIENLESERNQNLSSTESALSKEETFWQQEIVGKWIPDEDATAEGYTGLVINSDKTCTANGENYTWTVTYANETNAEIDLYKDKEKKCKLFFSLNSKRGYKRATIGMYQDEYYAPNLKGAYFAEEDYTVVNITKDNWQEYFEIKPVLKDFDFETIGYLSYLGAVLSYVDTEEYAYSELSNAIKIYMSILLLITRAI